jgi:serine/threonine-protein kinase ULK4
MHSVVYKGRKKKTIEYFAIKSVVKSQKQRVHQEVRSFCLQSLRHTHISQHYAL